MFPVDSFKGRTGFVDVAFLFGVDNKTWQVLVIEWPEQKVGHVLKEIK